MSVYKKDNKFITLIVVLLSLFILIFFTKDAFYTMQENLDVENELEVERKEKNEQLKKIEEIEASLTSGDKKAEIEKFLKSFSEDELILYLHDYVEDINTQDSMIIIRNLIIEEPKDNELGFKEANVKIDVKVTNDEILKVFLNFLTSDKSKYTFFINDFSFKNDWRKWTFNVTIPLRLFYK